MARTKAQKKDIVSKLETIMDGSKSLVFVNVKGLKVSDSTLMRKKLKKEGVGLFVAKNTLTSIALNNKKYDGSAPVLSGETALAYGADLTAPAREVYEFQKKFKGQVSISGGVFESRFMSKDEMVGIASIPPLKTLYGMFANIINSPIQGLVMALDQISKKKA
jgi:large subunit ribosomal protein L10